MSTPYLTVRENYLKFWKAGMMTWEEQVGWYLAEDGGHVQKTPNYFVMGRAVVKETGSMCRDLRVRFPVPQCNCWYIAFFCGDKRTVFNALPYHLPWLCWQRFEDADKDLHFLPTSRIAELCNL